MSCTFREIIAKCPGSQGTLWAQEELTRQDIDAKMPEWKSKEADAPMSADESFKNTPDYLQNRWS